MILREQFQEIGNSVKGEFGFHAQGRRAEN